jgi:hypothetical protein
MSRLLFLGHVWPEPTSSAAGQRTLRLLRLLRGAGWQVTFACAAALGEHATDLGTLEVEAATIALNCSSFDEFMGDLAPEVVVFDRFMTEEQFGWRVERAVPSAVRVLDTVDLHFLRRARRRAQGAVDACAEPDLHGEDAWREIASILRVDLALVISQVEHDLLTGRFPVPARQLQYVPFLLEPDEPRRPDFEARAGFTTIGNFRHPPNLDSVRWLHREIWPAVRRLLPSAQLTVHGAYPPAEATALHDPAGGFLVAGRAKDSVEALARARVCLAPLRFGAGLKGKLVDAMCAGTPSVTTPVGAEGIAEADGWPGAVAEDAEDLARQAASLHDDPALWAAAHQRGFDVLRERFDGAVHGARLVERLDGLREGLEDQRRENFVGAMLRHHHQRSTEFMGRWIEEKNRARSEGRGKP